MKNVVSVLVEGVKGQSQNQFYVVCEKNKGRKLTCVSLGVCAELPPGAFRVSGGFHSRSWSQRVLLPQSHDLTCGCVVLQCLR